MAAGNTQKMWRKAIGVTAILVFLGFGMVVFNLARLQLVQGEELKSRALNQSLSSTVLSATRGTIYDRTGEKELAVSSSAWTVVLEPAYITKDETKQILAKGLSEILGMEQSEIEEKLAQKTYYSVLKRRVEIDVRNQIQEFLEENNISQGVDLLDDYKRYYPYGTTASTVLGHLGADGYGISGIEYQYNAQLQGTAGRLVNAKNALGTDMPFQYENLQTAKNGNDLVLTIDETAQSIMDKYLKEGVSRYMVENGAVAILMDVETGAILGLSSQNNYDPNDPFVIYDEAERQAIDALPESEQDAAYSTALYKQWRNKAVNDTYYPGSVFKMVVGSMALEEGIVDTTTINYNCTGAYHFNYSNTSPISCWNRNGHGAESFTNGLMNSCNPYFIWLGSQLGAPTFFEYFEAFGMTSKTGIDLPGESESIYYNVEGLKPVELATESMGQNFSITPIQMITAVAAVANGGYLVQPHVVDRIIDGEGNIVSTADASYKRQVISEETSKSMREILQMNVDAGTAQNGGVTGYHISAKTGTSEKVAQYLEDKSQPMQYIASYCGFAPSENPQYALLVFFDEPQKDQNGGLNGGNAVAGPIFADMMAELLPYLGVKTQYTEEELAQLGVTAPNVTGLTVSEAKELLENLEGYDLSYKIVGNDGDDEIISIQVPQVGASMPKDGMVALYTTDYQDVEMVKVPDFTGMSLEDAKLEAEYAGLQVTVQGSMTSGYVSTQDRVAGEEVKQGTIITISFVEDVITDTFGVTG